MLKRNLSRVRYKLIRFEDLVQDPFSAVDDLYKFAGIEMLVSIKIGRTKKPK